MITDKSGKIFDDRRKSDRRITETKVQQDRRTSERRKNKASKK